MTFNPICDRIITDFLYEGKEIFLFSPLKLKPAFKDYLWGGTKLRDNYNKKSSMEKIAESWELSCHKDGNSVISNGEAAGMTLAAYIENMMGDNEEKAMMAHPDWPLSYPPVNWKQFLEGPKGDGL